MINEEKARKYDEMVKAWNSEGKTTVEFLRDLAAIIDGVEIPKRKSRF